MYKRNGMYRAASISTSVFALLLSHAAWSASDDCSLLDPRVSVSKEREGKVDASAGTVFKLGNVSGEVAGKDKEVIQNLPPNAGAAELNNRARLLIACKLASDPQFSPEQKTRIITQAMEGDRALNAQTVTNRPVAKSRPAVQRIQPASGPVGVERAVPSGLPPGSVVGRQIIGNGQGGDTPIEEIRSEGGGVGKETIVCSDGKSGGPVIGENIVQSGPGIAQRIVQSGPGIGQKITVVNGGDCRAAH